MKQLHINRRRDGEERERAQNAGVDEPEALSETARRIHFRLYPAHSRRLAISTTASARRRSSPHSLLLTDQSESSPRRAMAFNREPNPFPRIFLDRGPFFADWSSSWRSVLVVRGHSGGENRSVWRRGAYGLRVLSLPHFFGGGTADAAQE